MNTKSLCFLWLFLLPIVSCSDKKPELTLSEDQLTAVLIDLEYAKAATHGQTRYLKDSMMLVYKDQICRIHDLSSEQLEKNLKALEEDQELLEKILRNVRDSLEN